MNDSEKQVEILRVDEGGDVWIRGERVGNSPELSKVLCGRNTLFFVNTEKEVQKQSENPYMFSSGSNQFIFRAGGCEDILLRATEITVGDRVVSSLEVFEALIAWAKWTLTVEVTQAE